LIQEFPMSTPPNPALGSPLFYRQPQPLSPRAHGRWRLRGGDYGFAGGVNAVPVTIGEFTSAMRHYPLAFAGETATPVAVLGLENRNLFVEEGRWAPDTYVPAYVRRYPFLSMAIESPEHFVLAIDGACERFAGGEEDGTEGIALFEGDTPSTLTRQMLGFCEAFRNDHAATLAWSAALKEQGLLDDRNVQATLPGSGRKLSFGGFQAVDPQRLARLDDAMLADWQRKGWLAWIHLHLASLERFVDLLARQGRNEPAAGAASAEAA
jgi:hypothetical protein